MGRYSKAARVFVWVALALLFTSGSVVATETYREYDSWEDRPLGILDILFGVAHQGLPEAPDWGCDKSRPPRLLDGQLTVKIATIDLTVNPFTESQWEALLSERLGVPVDVEGAGLYPSLEAIHEESLQDRGTAYLALRTGYFRGDHLNEKIEGVACNNLATMNAEAACQEGVAAHEMAHVLGVRHSATGLMRARAAACHETLNPDQTAYLLANSLISPPVGLKAPATQTEDGNEERTSKGEDTETCDLNAC